MINRLNVKFCFFAKLILARKFNLSDILTVKKYAYFSAKIQINVLASFHQNGFFLTQNVLLPHSVSKKIDFSQELNFSN